MRILFISNDLIAGHLAFLLKNEGHNVKLYIHEEGRKGNFHNLVKKVHDWRSELKWVGKKGLIVFDDVGFGHYQETLRQKGYNVFGGSEKGDLLEQNRVFGQKIMHKYGIRVMPILNFDSISKAINYVKKNPCDWVVKQNGHANKGINYVGFFRDGRDVIDVLNSYKHNNSHGSQIISLQKKINGIEIAITRYFNGKDWIGPMLINIEHKKFFPGDLGPTTSEMGTLGWYENDEKNKLFLETLAKLKPYLQKINYRGIIDINCIVNEKGAFPLEITSRPGSPIIHLQTELNISPWSGLLKSISKAESYELKYKKGYGIVVVVAIPPFPYSKKIHEHSQLGNHIFFDENISPQEMKQVHFEEVSLHKKNMLHYISDSRGYILYVTGHGNTVEKAIDQAYSVIHKIHIPKMFYRDDIGEKFIKESKKLLQKWGYISKSK